MDVPHLLGQLAVTHDMPGLDHMNVAPTSFGAALVDVEGKPFIARRVLVGTGGDLELRSAVSGRNAIYYNLPDAGFVDGYFDMVVAAGTTAEDITAQS